MSMEKYPEHRKRELLLSDRIAQNSVKYAIENIFDINEDDRQKEDIYKNWEDVLEAKYGKDFDDK